MSISIIIVNYMKASRLSESVTAILSGDKEYVSEIIIIDNSTDDTQTSILRSLPNDARVSVYFSPRNIGYAAAVNMGTHSAKPGNHILLMSPDIIVEDQGIFKTLCNELLSEPDIGLLCPIQYNDDGSVVEVGRDFPTVAALLLRRLFNREDPINATGIGIVQDVDWAQSSFSLINASLWQKLNGLHERYFLFMADTHLGAESWIAGYKVRVADLGPALRADGIRASAGGLSQILRRTVRIHLKDAFKYFVLGGASAARRAKKARAGA